MNFDSFGISDWPAVVFAGQLPESAWAALLSAVVTLGLALGFLPRRERAQPAPARPEDAAACDFLLNGASVRPLTAPARALLAGFGGGTGAPLHGLTRHLARDCPTIQEDLEALVLFGEAFRRHVTRADGSSFEILGRPEGAAARLSIRPASAEARALDAAERALARTRDDLAFQREALDRAPVLAWALAPDGTLSWANAAYRDRFDPPEPGRLDARPPNVFAHVLEEVPLTARAEGESRRRVKLPAPGDADAQWFEVSERPLPSGETLAYAVEVDDLVAAEASLRRFVETLTETFAHLPIGLAVFDKNRRLGLFNPALSDLVRIDAVWLAGRPSLRDFLERLRETRQMPEQKDFAAFRRMLTELEEGARQGTYEENWQLPSGKIFRVSGRPHPQGAVAFLFEDISPTIQLERRYRSELELSQATLDRIGEAVAVFDTSGMLVFVNAAFERLWELQPMSALEGPSVRELAELWASRCRPSPSWARIAAFATGEEARTIWSAEVETVAGVPLDVQVAPLPDGSSLVTFRDRRSLGAAEGVQPGLQEVALLSDLALAELELPVEAALRTLAAAVGTAPDHASFSALTASAQRLKDGLARARALQADATAVLTSARPAAPGAPAIGPHLERLLALRGLRLGPVRRPDEAEPDGPEAADLAAVAAPLAFALAALAAPGSIVEAAVSLRPAALALRAPAEAPALPPPGRRGGRGTADEPPAVALARRRLAALGATIEIAGEGDRIALAARFAARPALAPPPAKAAKPRAASV